MVDDYKKHVKNLNSKYKDIGFYYRAGTLITEGIFPKKYQRVLKRCKVLSDKNPGVDIMVLRNKKGFRYLLLNPEQRVTEFKKDRGLARLILSNEFNFPIKENERLYGVRDVLRPITFGFITLFGLFFGISSLTGAAIGFSKSFSLPIGVVFFVLGILGLFFGRKL